MDGRARAVALAAALTLAAAGCGGDGTSPEPSDDAAARSTGTASSESTTSELRGVTVVGEGRVSAAPDTARMVVGVEVERPDVGAAFDEASDAAREVIEALREGGVDEDDIRTERLSVRDRLEPPPGTPHPSGPEVRGYVVTNLVEVTVRDLDRAGELVTAAVSAGGDAARVQRFELSVDQDGPQMQEAREAAFSDAERRAEQYAELAGRALGPLAAVSELSGTRPPTPLGGHGQLGGDAAAPPVEPGQQEVTVRIQATWQLE